MIELSISAEAVFGQFVDVKSPNGPGSCGIVPGPLQGKYYSDARSIKIRQ